MRHHLGRLALGLPPALLGLLAAIGSVGASVQSVVDGGDAVPAAAAGLAGLVVAGGLLVAAAALRPEGLVPRRHGIAGLEGIGRVMRGTVTVRVDGRDLRARCDGHELVLSGWSEIGTTLALDGRPVAVVRGLSFVGYRVYALDPQRPAVDVRTARRFLAGPALPATLVGAGAEPLGGLDADGGLRAGGRSAGFGAAGVSAWRLDAGTHDAAERTALVLLALTPGLVLLTERSRITAGA